MSIINKKNLLAILLIGVLIIFVWMLFRKSSVLKENEIEKLSPTPTESIKDSFVLTPTPTTIKETESDTGADIWTVSGEQKKIDEEMLTLENKVPVENDKFKLIFDYDVNIFSFVVSFKTSREEGLENLKKWLIENGYGDIPIDQFVIR